MSWFDLQQNKVGETDYQQHQSFLSWACNADLADLKGQSSRQKYSLEELSILRLL